MPDLYTTMFLDPFGEYDSRSDEEKVRELRDYFQRFVYDDDAEDPLGGFFLVLGIERGEQAGKRFWKAWMGRQRGLSSRIRSGLTRFAR